MDILRHMTFNRITFSQRFVILETKFGAKSQFRQVSPNYPRWEWIR